MKTSIAVVILISVFGACERQAEPPPEFREFRLHRWTALDGGESIVIRRVGDEWSGMLMGDGARFSCLYQHSTRPQSDWEQVWERIISSNLVGLNGKKGELIVEDGNGFDGEITVAGKTTRFSIPQPKQQTFPEAKDILELSDYLSKELTPLFLSQTIAERHWVIILLQTVKTSESD